MRDLLAAVVLFCAQYDKGNYPAVTAFSGFQKKYPDVVRRHFSVPRCTVTARL
jgi:hypothetical protein